MTSTPWTATATSAPVGNGGQLTLVDGASFVVSSRSGELTGEGHDGLFLFDTRVLSRWLVEIDDCPLEAVSSVARGPFAASIVARPPRTGAEPKDSQLVVVANRTLGRGLREDLTLRNYSPVPATATLRITFDADFASLFEVKSGNAPADPLEVRLRSMGSGFDLEPVSAVALSNPLSTVIRFHPAPNQSDYNAALWHLEIEPGGEAQICAEIGVEVDGERLEPAVRCGEPIDDSVQSQRFAQWNASVAQVEADNDDLVQATRQALEDLGSLRIFDPNRTDRVVVAAGAPWFMTLFGRDSILTAWMALLADHNLAAGVLQSLAELQGTKVLAATEEQPGRILHEVRYDHHSLNLLGGSNVYYGTIDATPLFVMLAAEHLRWTGDRAVAASLLPAVDRALTWIDTYGDRDDDGFVEYQRLTPGGLGNQGWKDSWDGIRYRDGRVAEAPIALCEAQAYVYGAFRARAYLARVFDDPSGEAAWSQRADELARAFDEAFWLEDDGYYCVGLDAGKKPIDSRTSNIGHCLWTGIVPPERSAQLADALTATSMFSGWGLRTLDAANPAYNPLSYHCGSVWPHDTTLAIAGLHRYGHHDQARLLRDGLLQAASTSGGRLPELFAGFARNDVPSPVAYPASCSPQAWAAASPLLMVRSLLGLDPDLPAGVLRVGPAPLHPSQYLYARGVPLGGGRVDIRADSSGIEIDGLPSRISLEHR